MLQPESTQPISDAIRQIITSHSLDYERLWASFNRTNRWLLQRLASGNSLQTSEYPTSTLYSALKQLQKKGYVIYTDSYELEDPFFKEWLLKEMHA